MRKLLMAGILAGLIVVPVRATAWPVTHNACSSQGTLSVFHAADGDVRENLGFDRLGYMWVSNATKGRVEKWNPSGNLVHTIPIASPGAITLHPTNGFLYVNSGAAAAGALTKSGQGKVYRFNPAIQYVGLSDLELVASGFNMANGAAFDKTGHYLYVSNDFDKGIVRIDVEAATWTTIATDIYGANGLVYFPDVNFPGGDMLYAAITFHQQSPIERIRMWTGEHEITHRLSTGVASLEPGVFSPNLAPGDHLLNDTLIPKGLDDMTLNRAGLYTYFLAAANGSGELLQVDFATNPGITYACVVAGNLRNPSSVRVADPSFMLPQHTFWEDAYITEFSGAIMHVGRCKTYFTCD